MAYDKICEGSLKKILYIVSTLRKSGPTNQLYNIIRNLDFTKFEPSVLTLSAEPEDKDSRWNDFNALGIKLGSLELSRVKGTLYGKKAVLNYIRSVEPDLVHTQGIRADSILASLNIATPWIMTARNFPLDDYPSKFGKIKGALMARKHLSAIKQCQHLVCCSKAILEKLKHFRSDGIAIQNGISLSVGDRKRPSLVNRLSRPIFVSVGSLIPRKNMELLVEAFKKASIGNGCLIILGDGFQKEELQSRSSENIHFLGNVSNVTDYLSCSDYFISTSLSEGLPNTVLEALECGLPTILSDIESHKEIESECGNACHIVSLDLGSEAFCEAIEKASEIFRDFSSDLSRKSVNSNFSAFKMSARYQEFYDNLLEEK